jgi:hypothetical protein
MVRMALNTPHQLDAGFPLDVGSLCQASTGPEMYLIEIRGFVGARNLISAARTLISAWEQL